MVITIESGTNCYSCNRPLNKIPTAGGCSCQHPYVSPHEYGSNSPCTSCPEESCIDPVFDDCLIYRGADIPALAIKENDKLRKIIVALASEIIALKSRVTDLEA